jgi:integrase
MAPANPQGPAPEAVSAFIQDLADRGFAASTRRIRRHFLNEALTHAQHDAGTHALTAAGLMRPERAAAWLADAAAGRTRTRNTMRGPDAEASPNSMRARAVTWNAFAEYLGLPDRLDPEPPADGYRLSPADTERLVHDLSVRRPIHANAMTALRTAAMAALVADTGLGVPELAGLKTDSLHLAGKDPHVDLGEESCPLDPATVHILSRWLSARAVIIAGLEGSDPGYLWIPTKPGRARDGRLPPKPGLMPAAVRTLHHAHRSLVSQLLGTPLRPGALRDLYEAREAEELAKAAQKAGQEPAKNP